MAATVPYWVQGVTALAAIAGPIITYLVASKNVEAVLTAARRQTAGALDTAQRQIHANVVSANRQKWIDSLRDEVASFLTESDSVRARLGHGPISNDELVNYGKPMVLVFNRVRLRLNPKEQDHQRLVALMEQILGNIKDPGVRKAEEEIAVVAQGILKREWARVKAGD